VAVCGSPGLVQFLAFEANPVALAVFVGAQGGGHHGHSAAWADRRTVVVIHAVSIPGSGESEGPELLAFLLPVGLVLLAGGGLDLTATRVDTGISSPSI
jgi:hypothetical protein